MSEKISTDNNFSFEPGREAADHLSAAAEEFKKAGERLELEEKIEEKKRKIKYWLGLIEDFRERIKQLLLSQASDDAVVAEDYKKEIKKYEAFIKRAEEDIAELRGSKNE